MNTMGAKCHLFRCAMAPNKLCLMGRSTAQTQFPDVAAPASRSPKTITLRPSSDSLPGRARYLRRQIKKPPFSGGRRSFPVTPHLSWKLDDAERLMRKPEQVGPSGEGRRDDKSAAGRLLTGLSARKLAAALWHFQAAEVSGGGRERRRARLGLEPNPRNLCLPNVCHHDRTGLLGSISNELVSSISSDPKATSRKLEASVSYLDLAMEKATKWEAGCLRFSDKVYHDDGHLKLPKDWLTTTSIISILQAELKQARHRINELENERRSAKEKLNHFLRKLAVEKASWQNRESREHEKVLNIIEVIKDDLSRERKVRKRVEIMNSKLVHELAEAKLLAKQSLQDYEKEKKERELIEEVCNQFAKEIGHDKAEAESLKRESTKIQEELDEERRMLQMAEVWREERVQMKLVDAKLMLEEKYAELSELQADLDAFLRAHSDSNGNMSLLKEAEAFREAASLLKFQDIKFHYQPPPSSGDIFSVFEELQPREETIEREIDPCCGYSPASHASKIHTVSPETDIFLENPMKMRDEDHSDLESMSYAEGQGSCNSPEAHEESVASVSGTDCDMKRDNDSLNSEISEVCSRTTRQSRKVSSIGRFWRSTCTSNGNKKKFSVGLSNENLLRGRMLNATLSPDMNSGEVCPSSPSVGQQCSSNSINSRISRGTEGCIE
ncbi:uncharacterized protein LOC135614130 [Musa acuminata AAA Group]|uniref:uncharacterized protein LOC135614130 n=1 Tax=Musa acuminata AAA Group TaxID=214697 RepID=UPI0031DE06D8